MNVRASLPAWVVSLCALTGGMLLTAPPAPAASPPVVEETAALNVAATSATLRASIDPQGSETTYRFEYGTSTAYGTSIPLPDGLLGAGSSPVTVTAHPQGLVPSTTYHFRVVAFVAERSETIPGADGAFTTQPAGGEFALPDGRQWELVTPPNKHGAQIRSLDAVSVTQASTDGSAITYGANVPTEAEPAGNGYLETGQVLSTRGPEGWSTRDIALPHESATGAIQPPTEYMDFSGDLSMGLALPGGFDETLLSPLASEETVSLRRESLCDHPATASECYLPLLTGKEGYADVPPGTKFGNVKGSYSRSVVQVEGNTRDLQHVVLKSTVALTSTPVPSPQLYEWTAGEPASEVLQLVSVLPAGEGGGPAPAASLGMVPANEPSGWRNAVSRDGSRIFWVSQGGLESRLYMRDTTRKETIRLDVQQPGVPSAGPSVAHFRIASSDGSKVFFTDDDASQRLTAQSGTQGQDLYECEIVEEAGRLTCRLTDLTPADEGRSAEVLYLPLGASEDGSYIYFMANGVIGDGSEHGATTGGCARGAAPSATCNLYEYHAGKIRFIATLSVEDEYDWGQPLAELGAITARVSPNGRYLAFMSDRSLTGYDNRDAISGKPDMEVYLYDAASGHLACASCNPTNSRPLGVEVRTMSTFARPNIVSVAEGLGGTYTSENWIAANLPLGYMNGQFSEGLYQQRLLSDGGRLFFNSSDALVPQDINEQEDVYEFEPAGVGSCGATSATFSAVADGCTTLISSGTSSDDSAFLDASEDGSDVFFLTSSRLASEDVDTAYDVYDAHECSASSPCASAPVRLPACESGDSCKAAPSPQPAIFGAPPSATFAGAGNLVAQSPSPARVAPRSLSRAQKLARALRACRKTRRGRKRRACERQARRRYQGRGSGRAALAKRGGRGASVDTSEGRR